MKKYSTLRMCKISCSCLSLSRSLSLLSVGAKSHVSTASGCVDSFTNRNVKCHTQGGLRDKGERRGAGNRTSVARGSGERHAKHRVRRAIINYKHGWCQRMERKHCCSTPRGSSAARRLCRIDAESVRMHINKLHNPFALYGDTSHAKRSLFSQGP